MKNHFFYSYFGNKREEVETIYKNINLDNIDTIIEPFCGSCAFSFYISTLHPNKYKYVINDNDKNLTELLKITQDKIKFDEFVQELEEVLKDIDKDKYLSIIKSGSLLGYVLMNYIYCIRPGLFPINKLKSIKGFISAPIINFLRTEDITILNNDAIDVVKNYMNIETSLIFLDPPYVMLNNDHYSSAKLNIYEFLYENTIDNFKSTIVLVLELNWIIKLLLGKHIKFTYDKKYQTTHKQTTHCIISNKTTDN